MATPVCQITPVGCVRPDFAACLAYIQNAYRGIYGQDIWLGADSQDGQFMALLANAIHDCNGQTLAVYNAYSPATAQGEGLSSVVKINGIRRKAPTYSTCDFVNIGQVGASITAGVVRDDAGNGWLLPDFIIPASGQITVTAACQTIGAIALSAGAVDTANGKGAIATPQLGWQAAINLSAAAPGQPVETDSQLRQRQSLSVGLPAQTILESLLGALYAITGVTRIRAYENDTGIIDPVTQAPGHTLTLVVEGGDATQIASVIAAKKSPGVGTYGDVLTSLTDAYGIAHPIRFFRPVALPIAWQVKVRPKMGYTVDVANAIRAALANYTASVSIGGNQELAAAYPVASLVGDPRAATFEVVGLTALRRDGTSDPFGDVQAAFDEAPTCATSDVAITTVPVGT